jgi:hypothetical protein
MSGSTIFTIVIVALAAIIALATTRKGNKKFKEGNEEVAKNFGWSLHSAGYITPVTVPLTPGYFIKKVLITQSSHYFEGSYKGNQFILFPAVDRQIPLGGWYFKYYLCSELKNISQKNSNLVIAVSGGEHSAFFAKHLKGYTKLAVDNGEFDLNFNVYGQPSKEPLKLSPEAVRSFIKIKELFKTDFVVEVNENSILVYGGYIPYLEYINSKNTITKSQIMSGFMDMVILLKQQLP